MREESVPVAAGRWRYRAARIGAVLLGLALAVRIALPYALERAVPRAAERFGFAASVANIDFGVLPGHVTVEGLRVAPAAAPERDLLSLGSAFVNVDWLGLLRGQLEVAELRLEKPVLSLVRAPDGTLELPPLPEPGAGEPAPDAKEIPMLPILLRSFAIRGTEFHLIDGAGGPNLVDFALSEIGFHDLRLVGSNVGLGGIRISEPRLRVRREVRTTKPPARSALPGPAAPGSAPPELRIDQLDIERAEFTVVTDGEPVQVALHLQTSGVTLAPRAPFPFDFRLEAGVGSVTLKGELGLNPPAFDGRVEWRGLAVPLFVRAVLPELVPWIRSCSASGDLAVKFSPEELRVSGRVGVDEFAVEDPEHEVALAWKSLVIVLRGARVPLSQRNPIEVAIEKISVDEPSARYVLPNTLIERLNAQRNGFADAMPVTEETSPAAQPALEPHISVDAIEVRRGSAEFVDRTGAQPYQGKVSQVQVDVTGVKLPERTVQSARVRGLAPERAPFDLRAALPGAQGTVRFSLEKLPLPQFTPYAARVADLRIPKGALSITTQGKFARSGDAGSAESQVVVHQLAIEGGSGAIALAGMPIDLALALLRDPRGDIALTVPVAYGEKGATADIGAIALGALQTAITGAVTSPIKALGVAIPEGGAASVSFAPMGFAPGDAALRGDAATRLAPLAELLAQRPGLALALIGRAGPDDRAALAERMLIELVAADRDLPEAADAGFFARRRVRSALDERGHGKPGELAPEDQELLRRYLDATAVPVERFSDLARRRAEAVRDALASAHGIVPARLLVESAAETGAPEVVPELRLGASS